MRSRVTSRVARRPVGSSSRGTRQVAPERKRRSAGAPVLVAVFSTALVVAGPARAAGSVRFADFVYADANEGSASGGHLALRLGDRTYHFGYHDPGLLLLDRDDSMRFLHVYGSLENRNLRLLRVAVPSETFERLRASFNERYLRELAERELVEALAADRAFFEGWLAGEPKVRVRAAGYFLPADDPAAPGSPALELVRRRVVARYGPGFLDARLRAVHAVQGGLAGEASSPVAALAPPSRHPAQGYGLRRRAANARSLALALAVLQRGAALRPAATVALEPEDYPIDHATDAMLASLTERFSRDIVELLDSPRTDVGFPLLVAMARLLAIEETRRSGRLVVLDVFPADASRLPVDEIEARGGRLEPLAAELGSELLRVRAILQTGSSPRESDDAPDQPAAALQTGWSPRESDYAALEAIANRYRELRRSRTTGADLRVARGRLLPAAPAELPIGVSRRPSAATLRRRIDELRAREHTQRKRLRRAHHYDLIGHNCVSELFAQVERAVGDGAGPSLGAAVTRLGGPVPQGRGLEVIPFLGAVAIEESLRVTEVVEMPSYRRRRVQAMVAREGLSAALRESNVLTSTVYERNALDSAFLFFTDDVVVARPLLGALNLLYGLGATAAGLPLAPFDRGRLLAAGLRGALWSVPEIAFVNVRKGSFFFVPRAEEAAIVEAGGQSPSR